MARIVDYRMKAGTRDRSHVYIQQLPYLWHWSWCCYLIIAINLLGFCCSSGVQAIRTTIAETPQSHADLNNAKATFSSTGNGTGDERTKERIAIVGGVSGDDAVVPAAGLGDDVRGITADGSNESINNSYGIFHERKIVEKVSLKSANTTGKGLAGKADVFLTARPRNAATSAAMEMDLDKGKGYTPSTSANRSGTTTSSTATSTAISITTSSTALAWDFNHTVAGGGQMEDETTYYEECLENRNSLAHVFTVALYSVVCVVGLFGNTLVIWVVFRFSKMQTVTNIYILNLAIADECFLIGIPFLLYTMRICSWKFGEYVCKAYMVSTSITQFTSSIFLLIMAADRYLAVCHPIESPRYRTLRIAKLVSMIAWITSAILMMPVILFASTVRQEDGINYSCNIDWPEVYKKHSGTTFILYTFLLGFATPLCFILVFYYLVIKKLHSVQQKHKSKEKKRSHRKVTRLVLTVITVYILCWLPHWVSQVSLINSFVGHRELTRVEILLVLLFGCLAYSNSAMNPILYAFLSDNFRKSFSKAFSCVTSHEVEAQLINENSVVTHKKSGSAAKQRKGSRRLSVPRAGGPTTPNNCFLAPTIVHNSAGGSSSGNSASTATTATDKSSNSNQKPKREINGSVVCTATKDGEKITLVVNQELQNAEKKQSGDQNQSQTNV